MKKILISILVLVSLSSNSVQANSIDEFIDSAKNKFSENRFINDVKTSKYLNEAKDKTISFFDNYISKSKDNKHYKNNIKKLGKAVIPTENFPQEGVIVYGDLDYYGRATYAMGTLTYDSISNKKTEQRKDPVGWKAPNGQSWNSYYGKQIVKLDNNYIYTGWFYNKSHMVADSLGGDEETHNLVTATRQQNVGNNDGKGGMAYLETKVRNYLKENKRGTVYYYVEQVYYQDELLPRKTIVSAQSKDNKINEMVEVSNTANNYKINYLTGEFIKLNQTKYYG